MELAFKTKVKRTYRQSAMTIFRTEYLKAQKQAGRKVNPATGDFHTEVAEAYAELAP